MQPLLNLKSFLAVLLILILPGSLLVAYFRDYSPGAGGHEHSEMGKGGGVAMNKGGDMSAAKSSGDSQGDKDAVKPSGDGHTAMGHDTIPKPPGGQTQPQAETSKSPARVRRTGTE